VIGHEVFRALLHALSRPGVPWRVPHCEDVPAAVELLTRAVWEPGDGPTLMSGESSPEVLLGLERGTEEEPERGATVVLVMDGDRQPDTRVRLTGPGVRGELVVRLPLAPRLIAARQEACSQAPLGVDLVLVGPGPVLTGLPRTTVVEILEEAADVHHRA
jgi:alpha-D-ribose 1-methylphosphonate 5-triphosphate synthase subunit PhnH